VNFTDNTFITPTPQTAFSNLLNQDSYNTNGGTGSARDYFKVCTYGKFSPDFDIYGPYTLPQSRGFYGKNDTNGNDTNPVQMIVDACTVANNNGVDFTPYDTDTMVLSTMFLFIMQGIMKPNMVLPIPFGPTDGLFIRNCYFLQVLIIQERRHRLLLMEKEYWTMPVLRN